MSAQVSSKVNNSQKSASSNPSSRINSAEKQNAPSPKLQSSEKRNADEKLSPEDEKKLLDKLEVLLTEGYKKHTLQQTPENYFFIEDIVNLPEFSQYSVQHVIEAVHSDGKLRFSVRGAKMRLKPPELNKDADVILSKKLAWILRHAAEKEGFSYDVGGYLYVDDILRLPEFNGYTENDLDRVVNTNDKKRFEMRLHPDTHRLQLRATQGHSVQVEGLQMRLITNPQEFPVVVHGTYFKNWSTIKTTGLKRMGRNHIHFACGETPEDGVISGMRASAEILIYIDMPHAMADGLEFFVSSNKVILCAGDSTGTIEPKYFKEVYQRQPRILIQRRLKVTAI